MYSLCDVSSEQLDTMIENAKKTSEAISATLRILLSVSNRNELDDKVWNLAVEVVDGKKSLGTAVRESLDTDQLELTLPTAWDHVKFVDVFEVLTAGDYLGVSDVREYPVHYERKRRRQADTRLVLGAVTVGYARVGGEKMKESLEAGIELYPENEFPLSGVYDDVTFHKR